MKHSSIMIAIGLALAALPAVSAQAQNTRSFVSPTGSDSNNCTLATPCRTLQAAYNVTNAGGEIAVLGTAGYGTLSIDKAVSIVNPGGFEAGIAVPSSGTGISIGAGTTDAVSLRGLTIDGGGVGENGIQLNSGASLTIENCAIRRFKRDGIIYQPNATSNLEVSNSLVAGNGNNGITIISATSGITINATFNHIETNNNVNDGLYAASTDGTIKATVAESVAAGNGTGFAANAVLPAVSTLVLFHSVAANNLTGFQADNTGGAVRAAQSMVTGNPSYGWITTLGGVVQSYGDNYIDDNGASVGTLVPYSRR